MCTTLDRYRNRIDSYRVDNEKHKMYLQTFMKNAFVYVIQILGMSCFLV